MRQDRSYIGAEDMETGPADNEVCIEVGLFLLISVGFIAFLLTHLGLLKRYFSAGKLDAILGIFIILILSPFGAHLIARLVTFLWEKLR